MPLFLLLGFAGLLGWSLFRLNQQDRIDNAMETAIVETLTRGFLVGLVVLWSAGKFTKGPDMRVASGLIAWVGFSALMLAGAALKIW